MSFNIYEVPADITDEQIKALTDEDIVESGLSGGEMRQSLLDRFRQEIKTEDVYYLNLSLERYGFVFEEDLITTLKGSESALVDIENFLYDSEDSVFHNSVWDFHNETVCVKIEDD